MFGDIGVPELLIILGIVVVLFGAGRVGRVGKDLGTSIKEFRKAMNEDDAPAASQPAQVVAQSQLPPAPAMPQQPPTAPPAAQSTNGPESRPPAVF